MIKDFFSLLDWENYMSISSLFFTFVFIFKINSGLNQVILCALFMWLIWCSSVRINQSNTWKQYFWVLLYNLVLITQALHQYFWVLLYNLVLITQTLHHLKIRERWWGNSLSTAMFKQLIPDHEKELRKHIFEVVPYKFLDTF